MRAAWSPRVVRIALLLRAAACSAVRFAFARRFHPGM